MENLVNAGLASFYKGRRVFITGHTGFKGAWLAATLHAFGAIVKGYALNPEQPGGLYDYFDRQLFAANILADIRDKEQLEHELLEFAPDFIFHLAAQPLVRRSYEIPAETFHINVTGTANLLEAVTKLRKNCTVIVVTTDKVYDNIEQHVLYNENDTLGGHDPYSASKACAELVVDSFRKSFFSTSSGNGPVKGLASARAGNVIGGGDWSRDRIMPDIINSLREQKPVQVRNPLAVRPWQHVLEAVGGYLLLGMRLNKDAGGFAKAFNFGPEPSDHLPVKDLVAKTIACWGAGEWNDASLPGSVHEAGLLQLDIRRAVTQLGWKPRLSADEAIQWTVDWYREADAKKIDQTLHQVKTYFAM